jgi:hypothetical protein
MIQYETTNSSFFVANKKYCETIESKLRTINLDCSGFCNCYGYDIEATLKRNNLTTKIRYIKSQSTQNGVVIPVDANEYAGIEVTVKGLNKKFSLSVGKSSFRRFFCTNKIKERIPKPYFINYNYPTDSVFVYNLIETLIDNNISKIKLSNGTLICKINVPTDDPLKILSDIEKIIKKWAL